MVRKRIKFFYSETQEELQKAIDDFLIDHDVDIVDVRYAVGVGVPTTWHYVAITYAGVV